MKETILELAGTYVGIAILIALLILAILRVRKIFATLNEMFCQTMKTKEGKWSLIRIMMGIAFACAMYGYIFDIYKNGFNDYAFTVLLVFGATGKLTDALSKKVNPLVNPTNDENK
jgi:hypothetical protein